MRSRRAQSVTIRDVAREANVSIASASRALNGMENVTEETRDRILEAARRLRYVPHSGARLLSTRRTNTLGVILPDLHGEFFSEIIRGADAAARVRGMQLLLSSSHDDGAAVAGAIRSMHGRVDGLLVMSPHVDAHVLTDNLSDDLPVVLLNTRGDAGEHPRFMVDNYAGAQAVVRHLAERARLVAHIAGPSDNYEAQDRQRGWFDALDGRRGPVLPGNFTEESGFAAGCAIARMQPRPDAVFAANDDMAIGCMDALVQLGVRVPDDVAVAGFDDIPIARLMRPSLTTVSAKIADLSRRALERLIRQVDGTDAPEALLQDIRPEVVVRDSSVRRAEPS
jgi:LacI family transcriptional regulator